jgi:hypothetical protein
MQHNLHLAAKAGPRARKLRNRGRYELRARRPHAAQEDYGGLVGAALALESKRTVHSCGGTFLTWSKGAPHGLISHYWLQIRLEV